MHQCHEGFGKIRMSLIAAACALAVISPATGQSNLGLSLPDLSEPLENRVCPDAPRKPDMLDWEPGGPGMSQSQLADTLYQIEAFRNVVEAGECSCELRYPSWDSTVSTVQNEYAELTRMDFLEIIPQLRSIRNQYQSEVRELCLQAGL